MGLGNAATQGLDCKSYIVWTVGMCMLYRVVSPIQIKEGEPTEEKKIITPGVPWLLVASSPGHSYFSMLHAEKQEWPGDKARLLDHLNCAFLVFTLVPEHF